MCNLFLVENSDKLMPDFFLGPNLNVSKNILRFSNSS